MPTYVYETIPSSPKAKPRRFEVEQRMSEPALAKDPSTGEPVRRIITGGLGVIGIDEKNNQPKQPGSDGGGHGCFPGCCALH
jgi:hypothetical protein